MQHVRISDIYVCCVLFRPLAFAKRSVTIEYKWKCKYFDAGTRLEYNWRRIAEIRSSETY